MLGPQFKNFRALQIVKWILLYSVYFADRAISDHMGIVGIILLD